MRYDFDSWVSRINTQSSKWSHLQEENPIAPHSRIALGVAEMDFPCATEILDAVVARAQRGILGYTISQDTAYLDSICSWQQRRFGVAAKPEHIVYCRGANLALTSAVEALTKLGEGIIIQPPTFQHFQRTVAQQGRLVVENTMLQAADGSYALDFADLEQKAADPNNTMLILCSPNNPTGNLWSEADLLRLGNICLSNGVRILSDDVHQDIVRRNLKFVSLASLFPESEDIIVITSLSKGFNVAGLQLCHVLIPRESDRSAFLAVIKRQGPSPLEIAATIAAYTEADSWLDEVNAYIDANMAYFGAYLAKELPEYACSLPEATYMCWVPIAASGMDADTFQKRLAEEAFLGLNTGAIYGGNGSEYVRFNVATPRFVLEEALNRFACFVRS